MNLFYSRQYDPSLALFYLFTFFTFLMQKYIFDHQIRGKHTRMQCIMRSLKPSKMHLQSSIQPTEYFPQILPWNEDKKKLNMMKQTKKKEKMKSVWRMLLVYRQDDEDGDDAVSVMDAVNLLRRRCWSRWRRSNAGDVR